MVHFAPVRASMRGKLKLADAPVKKARDLPNWPVVEKKPVKRPVAPIPESPEKP